jgi:hypothetical protein
MFLKKYFQWVDYTWKIYHLNFSLNVERWVQVFIGWHTGESFSNHRHQNQTTIRDQIFFFTFVLLLLLRECLFIHKTFRRMDTHCGSGSYAEFCRFMIFPKKKIKKMKNRNLKIKQISLLCFACEFCNLRCETRKFFKVEKLKFSFSSVLWSLKSKRKKKTSMEITARWKFVKNLSRRRSADGTDSHSCARECGM